MWDLRNDATAAMRNGLVTTKMMQLNLRNTAFTALIFADIFETNF
jgi:hypothetical protein